MPRGASLVTFAAIDADAPFAWSPSGEQVALVREGVHVRDRASGVERRLATGRPVALAWSPSGDRLAAAFQESAQVRLRVLGLDGVLSGQVSLAGEIDSLVWSPSGELLAVASIRKQYSFGSNVRSVLYRWSGEGQATALPLSETTLTGKRAHLVVGESALGGGPVLSPLGDEVLGTALHAPPAFPPYKALLLVNLGTHVIRKIAHLPPNSPGGIFSVDAEQVLFRGSGYSSSQQESWPLVDSNAWAFPDAGRCLVISPGGRYLFAGGKLLDGGQELLAFPLGSVACFSPEGDRLLVRIGPQLHLLAGLEADSAAPLPVELRDDLLALRRWRSLALIGTPEYVQRLKVAKAGGLSELPDPHTYSQTELAVRLIELRGEPNWIGAYAEVGALPAGKAPTPRHQALEERLIELKAAFDDRELGEWQYGKEKLRVLDELGVGERG